ITTELYGRRNATTKFVPVFFDEEDERFVPEPLRGHTSYRVAADERYRALRAFLHGAAGVEPARLGAPLLEAPHPAELWRAAEEAARENVARLRARVAADDWLAGDARTYVGRAVEKDIARFLASDRQAMLIIGQSGVGKTTLVTR